MKLGSHVSMSKGVEGAVKEALSYNATALMLYTGAPQNTIRKPVDKLLIEEGVALLKENNIPLENMVVHAPYIVNLGNPDDEKWNFSVDFLKKEIKRVSAIGATYLVLHPGSYHADTSLEYGIERISKGLNKILEEDTNVVICLETMAGKGKEVGRNFKEIQGIISQIEKQDNIAVCCDTCHLHDSGYDIVNDFDTVLKDFDNTIGLEKLKVFHINGSLNPRGAKKDRHANLGAKKDNPKGVDHIGFEAIYNIVHNDLLKDVIFILETPWLDEKTNLYKEEIEALRK
ncbi:MAG: deoxyribonuclease IV [Lachnospirales bacterium]